MVVGLVGLTASILTAVAVVVRRLRVVRPHLLLLPEVQQLLVILELVGLVVKTKQGVLQTEAVEQVLVDIPAMAEWVAVQGRVMLHTEVLAVLPEVAGMLICKTTLQTLLTN